MLAQPLNIEAAILGESAESESRVVAEASPRQMSRAEQRADFRRRKADAQRALDAASRKLADENGVAFVEGQRVVSLTELWFQLKPGTPMMCAGWPGTITRIADTIASIAWDGIAAPYLIRRDQMRRTLRITT
jgi:hypothetical protein